MADDDWEEAAATQMAHLELTQPKLRSVASPRKDARKAASGSFREKQPLRRDTFLSENADSFVPMSAAAVVASAHDDPIDPVFMSAMENPRERISLLKYEDMILQFLNQSRETRLEFPPLSSFHRLLVHRLAERFHLDHQSIDVSPQLSEGYEVSSGRGIALFKGADTRIPKTLFISLATEKSKQDQSSAAAPRILVKKRNGSGQGNARNADTSKGGCGDSKMTVEDREKAYAEARARIFGTTEASTVTAAKPGSPSKGQEAAADRPQVSAGKGRGVTRVQAKGPDGTTGFGSGRGKQQPGGGEKAPVGKVWKDSATAAASNAQTPAVAKQSDQGVPQQRQSGQGGQQQRQQRAEKNNSKSENGSKSRSQNWKESKVVWKNREAEMHDPDFARNYDMYRPTFAPYRMVEQVPMHHPQAYHAHAHMDSAMMHPHAPIMDPSGMMYYPQQAEYMSPSPPPPPGDYRMGHYPSPPPPMPGHPAYGSLGYGADYHAEYYPPPGGMGMDYGGGRQPALQGHRYGGNADGHSRQGSSQSQQAVLPNNSYENAFPKLSR